jgi:hypothetical protein
VLQPGEKAGAQREWWQDGNQSRQQPAGDEQIAPLLLAGGAGLDVILDPPARGAIHLVVQIGREQVV